jgi:CopG family nickel-responsive transcriptional regulator
MMTIISLSVPDQMIKTMDEIEKSHGFAGRSELVRAAIRLLFEDTREKESLTGRISAVLVATHNPEDEEVVTKLKHDYEDIVKMHVHSKTMGNSCVEVFLLDGEGPQIASMTEGFQKENGMKSVKLMTI